MKDFVRHSRHLMRMAALFGCGLAAFLLAQLVFVPRDFGQFGHYRGGALKDNMAREPRHAGAATCRECHTDKADLMRGTGHERIGCESCHGPQGDHAKDQEKSKPALPVAEPLCLRCHTQETARPKGFKQVDPSEHGGPACLKCHTSHDPVKSKEVAQ